VLVLDLMAVCWRWWSISRQLELFGINSASSHYDRIDRSAVCCLWIVPALFSNIRRGHWERNSKQAKQSLEASNATFLIVVSVTTCVFCKEKRLEKLQKPTKKNERRDMITQMSHRTESLFSKSDGNRQGVYYEVSYTSSTFDYSY